MPVDALQADPSTKTHNTGSGEPVLNFAAIAEFLPNLVFVTDPGGGNVYANRRFQEYTGFTAQQLAGNGWLATLHPDDRVRASTSWTASHKTRETFEGQFRYASVDGQYRWHLCRATPMLKDGETLGWVGSCSDIEASVALRVKELTKSNLALQTEIKQREVAQSALVQAQKLEALGQLTSGIAHDFNNILAAISSGLSLIERRATDPYILEISKHSKSAAWRGAKLVKQMLAFARQEVMVPSSVSLASICHEFEPLIRQAIPGNVINFDIPAELPAVIVDIVLLESALLNLAVNANDAMPGGGAITILARSSPRDEKKRPIELAGRDAVAITLRDTGSGIAPDVLQRVTEPFYTTKELGKGTGLGLAMVQGFATQSLGALRIESQVGLGTSVSIYLPCSTEELAEEAEAPVAMDQHAPPNTSVLIVDDDDDVRTLTAMQLQELGYLVTQAADFTSALALVEAQSFHIVITDVVMAGGDGITLAAGVRERNRHLPILLMTGRTASERLVGETVLHKPFKFQELSRVVKKLVDDAAREIATVSRIKGRLISPSLVKMLADWESAKVACKRAPYETFNISHCDEPNKLALLDVDQTKVPMHFVYTSIGADLEASLGSRSVDLEVQIRGADEAGSQEESYRRSVKSGLPVYDYTRMNFGEGNVEHFERLVLPYSSDGIAIDRLVVLVMLSSVASN
jgi:PAS domain S-box-containing protein